MRSLLFLVFTFDIWVRINAQVSQLTVENFHVVESSVNTPEGAWMIMFYAPWCKHSKRLDPTLEDVSIILQGEVQVGKVDVTRNKKLGAKFEIDGFPTVLVYHFGRAYTFKGRRSSEELIAFARGGYQIHEPEHVRQNLGVLGDAVHVYRHAQKHAARDLMEGRVFTVNVYLTFLPVLAVLLFAVFLCLPPVANEPVKAKKAKND